ncbi:MAG: T9SS type A sorting domain-containing protein [Candidatus Kapaibacterium sp.]
MKTRNFWIFGVLLAAVTLLPTPMVNAQNKMVQTDTVTLSWDSSRFMLRSFDTVAVGNTECHTIFFQNTGSTPLIINSIFEFDGSGSFTAKVIPSLPLILLQNEIVSIADICFSPGANTSSVDYGALAIRGTIGSSNLDIDAQVSGFQKPDTLISKPCVEISFDSTFFGPIIMDGDITHTGTIKSNRLDSIQVRMDTAIYGDGKAFLVSGITFPYMLAPLEVKTFNITFSPRSNTPIVKYRDVGYLSLQVGCNVDFLKLTLGGVAIPPTADSISTSLAAGSTDVLAMISNNSVTTQTFHFTNTGTTNLKITAVALKNGKSFAITNIQPTNTLPFILTPGQSMSVTIAMTTTTNGVYYDEVIITAENAIISMDFQLQGLRKDGTLSVNNSSSESQRLMIYPNPSHGGITVDIPGMRNAKIQVLDLLGRVIASSTASEKWIWNSNAPAGTYTLHVTGSDETGKTFQSYDRFLIEK